VEGIERVRCLGGNLEVYLMSVVGKCFLKGKVLGEREIERESACTEGYMGISQGWWWGVCRVLGE